MHLLPVLQRLKSSALFKTVRLSAESPILSEWNSTQLPAVLLYPAGSQGAALTDELAPSQELAQVYAIRLIAALPDIAANNGDPFADALHELRQQLIGFTPAERQSPLRSVRAELLSANTNTIVWQELFASNLTYRN